MTTTLDLRLDEILPRITSPDLLSSKGIGNEIACYIFDYPANEELKVRRHLEWMVLRLASHHQEIKLLHLNLLEVVVEYLQRRGLYDKALKLEPSRALAALKGPMAAEKVCKFIEETHRPAEHSLFLLSGVGSVWPLLRAHSILNCLHRMIGQTPLVMFYPGSFDGTTLRLFGQIDVASERSGARPYYRAFILIPGGNEK